MHFYTFCMLLPCFHALPATCLCWLFFSSFARATERKDRICARMRVATPAHIACCYITTFLLLLQSPHFPLCFPDLFIHTLVPFLRMHDISCNLLVFVTIVSGYLVRYTTTVSITTLYRIPSHAS